MPIDFDAINLDDALNEAEQSTDAKLASEISSVTRMTDAEIQELFPEPADKEKLQRLLSIVKSAEDHNTKLTRLASNVESLGGTALTLLGKFV